MQHTHLVPSPVIDRPKTLSIVRAFALPAAAAAIAAGAILWQSRAWVGKSFALLLAGALMVLTEVPRSQVRGAILRGPSLAVGALAATGIVLALAAGAMALGAPSVRLLPAAVVVIALQIVGRLDDGGLVVRRITVEAALALGVVVVAVGAEELRRFEIRIAPSVETEDTPLDRGEPVVVADGGGAVEEPYAAPDPNLPTVFGGAAPGEGPAAPSSGSCPEELGEENTALLWMRLYERRDEGAALLTEEGHEPAAVVPRRLHCACAPQRERSNVLLAYCGRTRELCQSEAGARADAGSCSVVAVSVARRVDCALTVRGITARADETSLGVTIRSVAAASKLVPQWATLDARALARGKLVPIRVQRLRWARGSTAPVEWRATNLPGAPRALAALGRALSRTGLSCQGGSCEGGGGAVAIDWCEGTNDAQAPSKVPAPSHKAQAPTKRPAKRGPGPPPGER
jgi:hypothetical protein